MTIEVKVKSGAKGALGVEKMGEVYVVRLKEKAHDGEANEALVRVLAEYFGVAKSRIRIVSGSKSHQKRVEIDSPMDF